MLFVYPLIDRTITIKICNQRYFWTHNDNAWLKSINPDLNINMSDPQNVSLSVWNRAACIAIITDKQITLEDEYDFPEKDLCAFRSFPHEQLVYATLLISKPCSCTMLWLSRYLPIYDVRENLLGCDLKVPCHFKITIIKNFKINNYCFRAISPKKSKHVILTRNSNCAYGII